MQIHPKCINVRPLVPLQEEQLDAKMMDDFWKLEDALFLLHGYTPLGHTTDELLSLFPSAYLKAQQSKKWGRFRELEEDGKSYFCAPPADWLGWAQEKHLPIPDMVRRRIPSDRTLEETSQPKPNPTDGPPSREEEAGLSPELTGGPPSREIDKRPRKHDPIQDGLLRNKIENVLACARKLAPDPKKRLPIRAMAAELERKLPKDVGYSRSTIRKILQGTYSASKRLGIAGL